VRLPKWEISLSPQQNSKKATPIFLTSTISFSRENLTRSKLKQFGLQRQALRQLVNQALVLNLAQSYGLIVTDEELLEM
jgi:hypothetical protein